MATSLAEPARRRWFVPVLACAIFAVQGDHLKLSSSAGKAPLNVRITGPARLLALGRGSSQKWTGCGYDVFWGDGPESRSPAVRVGSDCAEGFRHTYREPGSYTLKARIWHPGPDDATKVDWSDTAIITVSKD